MMTMTRTIPIFCEPWKNHDELQRPKNKAERQLTENGKTSFRGNAWCAWKRNTAVQPVVPQHPPLTRILFATNAFQCTLGASCRMMTAATAD